MREGKGRTTVTEAQAAGPGQVPPPGSDPASWPRTGVFASFAHRDFRLFWVGALVSNVGSWMQMYALSIVVFSLRRSSFDLGLVGFLSGIPTLFIALPAGAIADRVDRRRMIILIQVVLLVQAAALGILYNTGRLGSHDPIRSLAWVCALGLVAGVFMAFQAPAFQSLMPDLVPRHLLMNGIALNSAQFQSSRLLGPLLAAGLVLAGAGMGEVFYVNSASFLFVIAALMAMHAHGHHAPGTAGTAGGGREGPWQQLTAGIRYARRDCAVGMLILTTAFTVLFGFPYMVLLPAVVSSALGLTGTELSRSVAFVMAANGLGAVAGALVVASLPAGARRDRIIPFALGLLALLLIAFSLSRWLPLMLLFSALAGGALLASTSLANTSMQVAAPHGLRGRIMALYVMAFMGQMPIASLLCGVVGQAVGPTNAVWIFALPLLGWALLLMARPGLLRPCARPAGEAPNPVG
jgi:MFS family permease